MLNAVPLMATASSKAITFSLIMFMVRVSLFCCCLGVRAIGGGEGRGLPGPKHHIQSFAQYSIAHKTENNSSPQSKKAITGALARRGGWVWCDLGG